MRRPQLARCREEAGHSQDSLARLLSVQRSTVLRWETGTSTPQPWIRPKLATALGLGLAELAALLNSGPSATELEMRQRPEIADMHRRELLRLITAVGASLAVPFDFDRLRYTSHRPGHTGVAMPEFAALNSALWRHYSAAKPKSSVLPLVQTQMAVLSAAIRECTRSSSRTKLCALLAELLQLCGEIYFDADHYTEAAHCYTTAARSAEAAGAFDLWACALTRHAFTAIYDHQPADALPLLEVAANVANLGNWELPTRQWVSAVTAEAHANNGDYGAAMRALTASETIRDMPSAPRTGWLRFDAARIEEQRGTCLLALHDYDAAEQQLLMALRPGISLRRNATINSELAVVSAGRKDAAMFVAYAGAAVDALDKTGSGVIGRKLGELRPHLSGLRPDKRVRELEAQLTSRMTG